MKVVLFLCWIIHYVTRNTVSQTVTWTIGTSVPTFHKDLTLVCTVSEDCCSSFSRVWENGTGTVILNDGITSFPAKYAEDWDGRTTGFNLTIKDLNTNDVGNDYKCQYKFGERKQPLVQDITWEYHPTENCPITRIKSGMFGRMRSKLDIAKAAPIPSVFALFGDKNVTSNVTVTVPTNFDTWFYSLTIYIDDVSCFERDVEKGLTLIIGTGTTNTTVCDKVNICQCWSCGIILFGYQCIGLSLNLIAAFAGFFQDCKQCIKLKELKKKRGAALATSFIITITLDAVIAAVGIHNCLCFDGEGPYMIITGIGTGFFGTLIAAIIYKEFDIVRYVFFLIFLGVVTIVVSVVDLSLIAEHLKGQCLDCGGLCFLMTFIGSAVALGGIYPYLVYKLHADKRRAAYFSCLICMINLVVCVVLAVPIGIYLCPCSDGRYFSFIGLGIAFPLILVAVLRCFSLLDNNDCSMRQCLCSLGLVMLSVLILPIPFIFFYFFLKADKDSILKRCLRYTGILVLSFQIYSIPLMIIYFYYLLDEKEEDSLGGNNRSKESGSSCWPPCSVGPDPNSPDPENARSLLKKNADKKNEKKPVAVVRSQPPKNRHVKTDNTESTRYSAETEIFDEGVHKSAKSRPLPSIGQPTISPRPLPQMPPSSQLEKGGIQLEPLGDSTSEKKKKKRRKKKESKQSGDED